MRWFFVFVAVACGLAHAACPALAPPDNGYNTGAGCTTGQNAVGTCQQNCNPGYYSNGCDSAARTCPILTNVWTGCAVVCNASKCPAASVSSPVAVGNCTVNGTLNSSCQLGCVAGYYPTASTPGQCLPVNSTSPLASWQGQSATCSPILCGAPPLNAPGVLPGTLLTGSSLGTTGQYACATGYVPSAVVTGTCTQVGYNGVWANASIVCTASNCTNYTAPGNGSVSGSCVAPVALGRSCNVTCRPGFAVASPLNSAVTCTAGPGVNASWSGPSAFCNASLCSLPTLPANGTLVPGFCPDQSNMGVACSVGCANGFVPTVNATLTRACQAIGNTSATSYGNFSYACYVCPGGAGNACFGHGNCSLNATTFVTSCACTNGWTSANCSALACPGDLITGPCSGNGTCDMTSNTCNCKTGLFGAACTVPAPVPLGVYPPLSPVTGGAAIDVIGIGFSAAHTGVVWCVFDNVTSGHFNATSITFFNSTLVNCVPPRAPDNAGVYRLRIVAQNMTLFTTNFTYYPLPVFLSRAPSGGLLAGGTTVNMTIQNYINRAETWIYFRDQTQPALNVSLIGSIISVKTPPTTGFGVTGTRSVVIGVTFNGRDFHFSDTTMQYTYYSPATVTFFTPSSLPGSQNTSTTVYIVGPFFYYDPVGTNLLYCRFTDASLNVTMVPAVYMSSAVLTCAFPPKKAQTVQVQITSNLQEYSVSRPYLYFGVPSRIVVGVNSSKTIDNVIGLPMHITASLVDVNGLPADPDTPYVIQAAISPPPLFSSGQVATSVQAVASFTMGLYGVLNSTYTITFSVLTQTSYTIAPSPPYYVRVLTCEEALAGGQQDPITKAIGFNYQCACAPGTYWAFDPVTITASCVPCAIGYAKNDFSTAVSQCIACPAGHHANTTGLVECLDCPAGYFTNQPAREDCTPCQQGTFSTPGSTSCVTCPTGHVSPVGSSECTSCQPGEYSSPAGFPCLTCPLGTASHRNAPSGGCNPCIAGFYADRPTEGCFPCLNGTYSGYQAIECVDCPPGTYTPQTGMGACLHCQTGTISGGGAGHCDVCPPGTVADPLSIICNQCPDGYQSAGGSCVPCPAGTFLNGTMQTCRDCEAGYFSDAAAPICQPCSTNKYTPRPGMGSCLVCGVGQTSANESASVGCVDCPEGTFSGSGPEGCQACAPGHYNNQTGIGACPVCLPGEFQDEYQSTSCKLCGSGSFSASTQSSVCIPCSDGYVAPQSGATGCIKCKAGSYAKGGTSCPCLEGYGYISCRQSCVKCPPGADCTGDDEPPRTKAGYYRRTTSDNMCSDNDDDYSDELATEFLRCFPAEACLGGFNSTCAEGFIGDRCATCAWRDDPTGKLYFRAYGKCQECPKWSGFIIWGLILFGVAIICWLILAASPRMSYLERDREKTHEDENIGSPVDVLSITIAAYQVISLVGSAGLNWTTTTSGLFGFMTFLSLNADGLPGCAMKLGPQYLAMYKLVLPVFALVVYFFTYLIVLCMAPKFKPDSKKYMARCTRFLSSKDRFIGAFITLIDVFYTTLAASALSAYNCIKIEDGTYVNESYPEVLCYTDPWRTFIVPGSIAGLIIYVLGFPLVLIAILGWNRRKLHTPQIMLRYGTVYTAFHSRWFWWTLTDKFNKLLVAVVVSIVSSNVYVRITGASLILSANIAGTVYAGPYRQKAINYVSIYGSLLAVICGLLGLASQTSDGITGLLATVIIIFLVIGYSIFALSTMGTILKKRMAAQRMWAEETVSGSNRVAFMPEPVRYANPLEESHQVVSEKRLPSSASKYLDEEDDLDYDDDLANDDFSRVMGGKVPSSSRRGSKQSDGTRDPRSPGSTVEDDYDYDDGVEMDMVGEMPSRGGNSRSFTSGQRAGSSGGGGGGGARGGMDPILEQSISHMIGSQEMTAAGILASPSEKAFRARESSAAAGMPSAKSRDASRRSTGSTGGGGGLRRSSAPQSRDDGSNSDPDLSSQPSYQDLPGALSPNEQFKRDYRTRSGMATPRSNGIRSVSISPSLSRGSSGTLDNAPQGIHATRGASSSAAAPAPLGQPLSGAGRQSSAPVTSIHTIATSSVAFPRSRTATGARGRSSGYAANPNIGRAGSATGSRARSAYNSSDDLDSPGPVRRQEPAGASSSGWGPTQLNNSRSQSALPSQATPGTPTGAGATGFFPPPMTKGQSEKSGLTGTGWRSPAALQVDPLAMADSDAGPWPPTPPKSSKFAY